MPMYEPIAIHILTSYSNNSGQKNQFATWAFINVWQHPMKRSADVLFVNEYPGGHIETVSNLEDLALMYPFRFFKQSEKNFEIRYLRHVILYIYLEAGLVDNALSDSLKNAKSCLALAFSVISKTYDAKGERSISCLEIS